MCSDTSTGESFAGPLQPPLRVPLLTACDAGSRDQEVRARPFRGDSYEAISGDLVTADEHLRRSALESLSCLSPSRSWRDLRASPSYVSHPFQGGGKTWLTRAWLTWLKAWLIDLPSSPRTGLRGALVGPLLNQQSWFPPCPLGTSWRGARLGHRELPHQSGRRPA